MKLPSDISYLTSYSLYTVYFGNDSVNKYFKKNVIIINHEENAPITPPGTKSIAILKRDFAQVYLQLS